MSKFLYSLQRTGTIFTINPAVFHPSFSLHKFPSTWRRNGRPAFWRPVITLIQIAGDCHSSTWGKLFYDAEKLIRWAVNPVLSSSTSSHCRLSAANCDEMSVSDPPMSWTQSRGFVSFCYNGSLDAERIDRGLPKKLHQENLEVTVLGPSGSLGTWLHHIATLILAILGLSSMTAWLKMLTRDCFEYTKAASELEESLR